MMVWFLATHRRVRKHYPIHTVYHIHRVIHSHFPFLELNISLSYRKMANSGGVVEGGALIFCTVIMHVTYLHTLLTRTSSSPFRGY